MPIYKKIIVNNTAKVFIWKIEETIDKLKEGILLTENSKKRVNSFHSEAHKKRFLSIRQLLKFVNLTDADLYYDEYNKPHIADNLGYVSITHSFNFSAIIFSKNTAVGIDIEKQREKILRIAHKFTSLENYKTTTNSDVLIRKLTVVWSAKESLYKIYSKKKLFFLNNIHIKDFKFEDKNTAGIIKYNAIKKTYSIKFFEFEDFVCVYAF